MDLAKTRIPPVFQRRHNDRGLLAGDTSFLLREPPDVYHAKRDKYLSSHQLIEFRRNPLLYRKRQFGLVQEEDRPAYLIGQAAHTLVLEGREPYESGYAFGGPINPKTGERYGSRTKAFEEWAAAQGKPVLTHEQMALIENLNATVFAHEHAAALLSDGLPEGVVRAEYWGVQCQARFDWFSPKRGIVDLKTCDNLDWLQTDARNFGYVHQLAFYRSLLTCVSGNVVPVYLIAVEKREPYRCGVWRMGEDVLGIGQKDNEDAIERLKDCRERDHWPTGYEDIRIFDWI